MSQANSETSKEMCFDDTLRQNASYVSLTPRMAWNLAAPHTWPASLLPVLFACCVAYKNYQVYWPEMTVILLIISVLMQSAVNTINDYFDYKKGADTKEDNLEESDAILVYNNIKPQSVLALAIAFVVFAFLIGIYVIYYSGLTPLIIGLVGAVVIFLYSGGKTPISYLPIGEIVSGFVMGGLISLASYQALTAQLEPLVIVWAFPIMLGIALIMLTNNTCDIEKDIPSKRRTLSVLLGRNKALFLYHACLVVWLLAIVGIAAVWFRSGLLFAPFMLLAVYPFVKALWVNPLEQTSRIAAMSQICSVNVVLGVFYAVSILI